MFEMYIEATVRGYHVYLDNVSVQVGEILACEMELDNSHDKYAVAVKNQDGNLVGHVPKELSRLFHKFLNDFGELEAECIGNRVNAGKGKGVEIPVTTDLRPMIHIWESSRGNYLRRTLLMTSTSVKFSKSQKTQQ
ncbi:unnamed protein product, partial [Porites evermanni]